MKMAKGNDTGDVPTMKETKKRRKSKKKRRKNGAGRGSDGWRRLASDRSLFFIYLPNE